MRIRNLDLRKVKDLWPEIDKHFGIAYDRELMDPMDMYEYLLENDAFLWVVTEGKSIIGYGIFILRIWPKCKIVDIPMVCSTKKGAFPTDLVIRTAEKLGRDNGCYKVIFSGRLGWTKRL